MKLKRALAGLMSVTLAAGIMTACTTTATYEDGGDDTTTAAQSGEETTAPAGETAETTSMEVTTNENAGTPEQIHDADYFKELYGTDDLIQLTVFSELANYNGKLTGWFAEVMKRKFNAELTIIPESSGTFDTRMESGNLGDIVVFGSTGDNYKRAATGGMLFDWNKYGMIDEYGSYTRDNMPYALQNNKNLNKDIGAGDVLYGFGHNVATSTEDHEAFFYTMDIRWDLYKQLNYPEMNSLDDLYNVFVQMKEICPKDENGNETYAMSLWPDWDGNMVMYVKAFATCYWGYDELGFGLYDCDNGTYHYALEENGPYLNSLKFFNKCYQAGLIDPNSMTQTYNEMSEKVTAGGVFFSIFDYAGSALYNTETHLSADTAMYPVVPSDATPLCYGMNVLGGNRVWTIGATTEYPELCMAIINWLTTPEGYMTYLYGPKDEDNNGCWYYDENGNSCLTELGEKCYTDRKGTTMPSEWGGGSFNDGTFQANNTTWSKDATNPDSNGETYNADNWISRRHDATYDILSDWRTWANGAYNSQEYMDSVNHKIAPGTSWAEGETSDELKVIWSQVADCIVTNSWKALYAKSDEEYDKIVADMIKQVNEYDPQGQCLAKCEQDAANRNALEEPVRG